MGTKPPDIRDRLRNMIKLARTPGCNTWLCQVDGELAAALAEIARLDRLLSETEEHHGDSVPDSRLVDHHPDPQQMELGWR